MASLAYVLSARRKNERNPRDESARADVRASAFPGRRGPSLCPRRVGGGGGGTRKWPTTDHERGEIAVVRTVDGVVVVVKKKKKKRKKENDRA